MGAVSVPRLEQHLDFGCKGFLLFGYNLRSRDVNARARVQYHVWSCLNLHQFIRIKELKGFFITSIHDKGVIDEIKRDFLRIKPEVGGQMVFSYVSAEDFKEYFSVFELIPEEGVIGEDVEMYGETWA